MAFVQSSVLTQPPAVYNLPFNIALLPPNRLGFVVYLLAERVYFAGAPLTLLYIWNVWTISALLVQPLGLSPTSQPPIT